MVNETHKFLQWPNAVIDSFFVSSDPNKLLFRDLVNHRLYVTADAGEHYNATELQFLPSVIQFSHNNADSLFAIDDRSSNLCVSNQLDDSWSWKTIGTAVKAAYWTQLKNGQKFDNHSAIYFAETVQSGGYRIMTVVSPYQNSSVHEFQGIGEVNDFKLAYEYIFVTKNVTNGSTLFVSYKRQPFVQAKFIPAMDENEHYTVVDASQGQVLLAVFKDGTTADLYISDDQGTNYSLSLRNVITNGNLQWNSGIESLDFYIVKGTGGTYIANVAVIETQQQSYNLTVISFNKGANWSPLTAPIMDSDMLPIECYYPNCSLHLDIHNSGIVSKKSAVGMIMARGTLGKGLSQNVGLYLSYDGGFSWRELFKANATNITYLFDILDSGSTIIVITGYNYTSDFMISCDTGFTWQTYSTHLDNYGSNNLYMPELYTDMSDTASLTTIYGHVEFPFFKYIVLNLNISQLNINECKDADYVTWMPSDRRIGDRCVLGEKVTYHKRKPRHCCRNKPYYWMPSDPMKCKCTIEDYGCDVGFERTDYNSPCQPVDGYYPFTPTDCTHGNYYYSSSNGYRRIAGDTCILEGNNYFNNKLLQPCPNRVFDLYINATPTTAAVDHPITFAVTVNGRHQFEATYFLFGDGSHVIQTTSNAVNHSYSTSGYFTVKVVVSTAAGNSSTTVGVFVEDMIVGASVLVLGPYAPLTYLFAVTVQYKTGEVIHYGSTSYSWKFNRFLSINYEFNDTSFPLLNHTFEYAGRYRYTLIVSNAVSHTHTEGGFTEIPTEVISSNAYSHTDNNSLKLGVGIGVPALVSVVSVLIGVMYCRRKSSCQRKQYGKLTISNQTSFFVVDDVDTGLERTNDIPMDDHEIVLYEAVTDHEAVTENL